MTTVEKGKVVLLIEPTDEEIEKAEEENAGKDDLVLIVQFVKPGADNEQQGQAEKNN